MTMTFVRLASRAVALASLAALAACQHPGTQRSSANASGPTSAATSTTTQPAANTSAPAVTFHLARTRPAPGLAQVQVNPTATLYAVPQPVLTQADLQQVVSTQNNAGQTFLRFDFNQQGAAKLAKLAQEAAGNYLMVSTRGKLVAVSQIASAYQGGAFPVQVQNAEEARAILQSLR